MIRRKIAESVYRQISKGIRSNHGSDLKGRMMAGNPLYPPILKLRL